MTQLSLDYGMLPVELRDRIAAARNSGQMTAAESAVLSLLLEYPGGARAGREKALQIAVMQGNWRRTGQQVWSDRVIKAAVKGLIEEHRVPIGSSRSGTPGYFLAIEMSDLEAAERPLRGEILSLAKRIRAFNPKSDIARHFAGQEELG